MSSIRNAMMPVLIVASAIVAATLHTTASRAAAVVKSEAGAVRVTEVADGLQTPWSLAFLPDGQLLVTERAGRMRVISPEGEVSAPLAGVPEVHAQGQGGLLDVVVGPEFENDRRVFFSYAEPVSGGARTTVASAVLNLEAMQLEDVERIFSQRDDPPGRHHFGSRIVFANDGTLFITLGDRNTNRERAQSLDSHIGKIVRINPDGSVPGDNPFVDKSGALPEIWSYGHRNVQGAALHPETGVLWSNEHGPRGGDEVNIGVAGANFGWPVITHGRDYVTTMRVGEGTERDDVEPPVHYWVPTSIAPSGMAFYTGDAFPEWKGSVFVGALRGEMLVRLELEGDKVVAEERLLTELSSRIRDVRQGPDGKLYVVDESNGRILKLEPQ